MEWKTPDTAPENRVILALFNGHKRPISAIWNEPRGKWVAAINHASLFHNEYNDTYFENEFFKKDNLLKWAEMPKINR